MTRPTRRALHVFLLLLLLPAVCWAGQIHYQDITLTQVPLTMLVQFLSEVVAGKKIKVKVVKVWPTVDAPRAAPRPGGATQSADPGATEYAVGATVVIALREPYVWDNPRRSPIVSRYWDVSEKPVKPGDNLLLVESFRGIFEPTAYTTAKAAKFELVANRQKLAEWIQQATDQTLIESYRDLDLRALSFAEVRKRKIPLVDFLKGQHDQDSFYALLSYFQYNDPTSKNRAPQNLALVTKNVAAFSEEQKVWLASWMNTNLQGAPELGIRLDFFLTCNLKSEESYAEFQRFSGDFYRQLEEGAELVLVQKFSRLFLKALGENPAKIGDSLNGALVEKLINALPPAAGHQLRVDFVTVVAKASKLTVIEKDPQHLIMYFLISHLRESKDSAAIDQFTKIDFRHPFFRAYFQYAVELLIDDEKSKKSHDKLRVRKFAESYPVGEFLAKMDADKKSRYEDFVK